MACAACRQQARQERRVEPRMRRVRRRQLHARQRGPVGWRWRAPVRLSRGHAAVPHVSDMHVRSASASHERPTQASVGPEPRRRRDRRGAATAAKQAVHTSSGLTRKLSGVSQRCMPYHREKIRTANMGFDPTQIQPFSPFLLPSGHQGRERARRLVRVVRIAMCFLLVGDFCGLCFSPPSSNTTSKKTKWQRKQRTEHAVTGEKRRLARLGPTEGGRARGVTAVKVREGQ